jgi:hypothetical protein
VISLRLNGLVTQEMSNRTRSQSCVSSRAGAVHFPVDLKTVSFEVDVDAEPSAALGSSNSPARLR